MVHADDRPPVRVLRIEHGKVQALDLDLLSELDGALARAEMDDVEALVVTGAGRAFSAGVDLFRLANGGAPYVDGFLPRLSDVLVRFFGWPGPVVTAVNGHAIAGGALLAWCGDVRLMAAGAGRIGVPELRVGVPFPVAPLEIARFAAGPRLSRAVLLGETWSPEEAMAHGVVDDVVLPETLVSRAVEIAAGLAAVPRDAFRLTKRLVREPTLARIEDRRPQWDPQVQRVWASASTHERIREYLARTVGRAG